MAQFGSPLSGGLQAVRTTVPSSIFRGIQSTDDGEAVRILRSSQFSLSVISTTLLGIQQKFGGLSNSLTQISSQLTQESFLEQNRIRQEQEQERRLAEQQAREGKESLVERKIQSALLIPVQAVAKRTQSILERLKGFFLTLLAGWLTNQLFQTIKAYSEGNTKKLEQIKNSVLSTLGVVGGTLLILNGGFLRIVGSVGRLAGKILKAVTGAIFKKPFQALAAAVSKVIPQSAKQMAKSAVGALGSFGRGLRSFAGGALRYGAPLVAGALEFTGRKSEGQTNVQAAAGTGASLAGAAAGAKTGAVLGSFLGPVGTFFGTVGGGVAGYMLGGKGADVLTGVETPQPKVAPSQPKTPSADNLKMSPSKREEQDFSKTPQYGEINVNTTEINQQSTTTNQQFTEINQQSTATNQQFAEINQQPNVNSYENIFNISKLETPQIQVSPLPSLQSKMQRVAPLPEPAPTIITAPPASSPSQRRPLPLTGKSSAIDIPSFSTSNPENFYVLYSQMHYNVVT